MKNAKSLAAVAAALQASATLALAQVPAGYRWDVPPVPPPSISHARPAPEPRQLAPADAPPVPRVESSRRNAAARRVDAAIAPTPIPSANELPSAGRRVAERPAQESAEPRRLEAPVAESLPILAVEAMGEEVRVGERTTFRIAVRNLGQTAAREVKLDVVVPQGIEIVATRPERRQAVEGRLVFDAGSLPARAERIIEIDAVPRRTGAFDFQPRVRMSETTSPASNAPAPNQPATNQAGTAQAAPAQAAPAPAALTLEIYAPASAATGDRVVCRAVVTNAGGSPATDVALVAEFPSTFETESDSRNERAFGAIPAGESREASFAVTPHEAGTMPLTFRAVGAGEVATALTGEMKILRRDLTLAIEGPSELHSRRSGLYRISIANTGETTLENAVLRCAIPDVLTVQAIDREARYEPHERILTLNVAQIAPGATEVLQIAAVGNLVGGQSLSATALAEGLAPTSVDYETEVAGRSDLAMTIATEAGPVAIGEAASIAVKLVNRGSDAAKKVKLRMLLPDDVDAVSVDGETSREVVVPAFDLAPGEERTAVFSIRARSAGDRLVQVILNSETLDRGLLQEANVHFFEASRKRVASKP